MTDIKRLRYEQKKICLDSDAYFSLFDKHIPYGLNEKSDVLLHSISNVGCILNIINRNPKASYTVVGNKYVNDALKLMLSPEIKARLVENLALEDSSSYDLIVINALDVRKHRQLAVEAIKHLKDERSSCVFLALCAWLTYRARFMRDDNSFRDFENSLAKHIETLELDNLHNRNGVSKQGFQDDAVYVIKKAETYNFYKRVYGDFVIPEKYIPFMERILAQLKQEGNSSKLKYYGKWSKKFKNYVVMDGIRPRMCRIAKIVNLFRVYCGYFANGVNAKGLTYSQASRANSDISKICIVAFDTPDEVKNCYESMMTKFAMFTLAALPIIKELIPWQADYTHPWTDDDFRKHYHITDDEWHWIETMIDGYCCRKNLLQ